MLCHWEPAWSRERGCTKRMSPSVRHLRSRLWVRGVTRKGPALPIWKYFYPPFGLQAVGHDPEKKSPHRSARCCSHLAPTAKLRREKEMVWGQRVTVTRRLWSQAVASGASSQSSSQVQLQLCHGRAAVLQFKTLGEPHLFGLKSLQTLVKAWAWEETHSLAAKENCA